MKNQKWLLLFVFTLFFACRETPNEKINEEISEKITIYPELDFDPDQSIIVFEKKPDNKFRAQVLENLFPRLISDSLKVRRCESCDTYMELWTGSEIGTDTHARLVNAGSGTGSRIVGEGYMAFLNIKSSIPEPDSNQMEYIDTVFYKSPPQPIEPNNKVVIAVIDTGIDLNATFGDRTQLWNNPYLSQGNINDPCYFRGDHGWNFIDDNDSIQDDHEFDENKIYHGTKVSQLIASQVDSNSSNNIEIMTLKTHDKNGSGDLFSNICAIHYAMDHGAHIINASWGFYDDKDIHETSYLFGLITEKIVENNILFVTAAGNEIPGVSPNSDDINPRNLEENNFIPAVFGTRDNNILVATTNNGGVVSPSQNFSSKYVDYGVHANYLDFGFKPQPGANNRERIFGSSYASAILAGRIGATIPVGTLQAGISKRDITTQLNPSESPQLRDDDKVHEGNYIHSTIQ